MIKLIFINFFLITVLLFNINSYAEPKAQATQEALYEGEKTTNDTFVTKDKATPTSTVKNKTMRSVFPTNKANTPTQETVFTDNKTLNLEALGAKISASQEENLPLEEMLPYEFMEIPEKSDFSSFWKAVFKTRFFGANYKLNAIFSSELYGKLKWDIMDHVSFQAKGLVIARNGFTSAIYERGDREGGRLYFLEGFFKLRVSPQFFLQMGTLQQSFLNAPLLITDTTFPSILGVLSINNPYGDLSLLFQSAIPDNAESVNRESQIGGIPLFLTSSVLFHTPKFFFDSDIKEIFTVFYFYSLPNDVAQKSRVYGNTIVGTGLGSSFEYGFLGIHNNVSIKRSLTDFWIIELGYEFLYNFKAENFYNEGTRLYSSVYHNYKNFMELRFKAELFANQSDSSVAYYNSEIYGHNDRQGFLASLQSHLYRSGLTIETAFVYSQPINKGGLGPAYSFTFSLMTNYVAI